MSEYGDAIDKSFDSFWALNAFEIESTILGWVDWEGRLHCGESFVYFCGDGVFGTVDAGNSALEKIVILLNAFGK